MPMKDPAHPGRLIRSSIEHEQLSVSEAAVRLGVSRQMLHGVLAGRSAISAEMALKLERAGWGKAPHWLRMQNAHDLAQILLAEEAEAQAAGQR